MAGTDIVVGMDGSMPSYAALRWAAAEAGRRFTRLHMIAACGWSARSVRAAGAAELQAMARDEYESVLNAATAEARKVAPDVEVVASIVLGEPAHELLAASGDAAMVVVGNRGHGGFSSLLLGSVSQRVATHAQVPVVVVRGRADAGPGPVVVGADGSPGGAQALAVAFEEAQRRGTNLIAVRAYTVPVPPRAAGLPPVVHDENSIRKTAADELDESLAPWREKYPTVAVESLVGRGSAAKILVDVSGTAGLVVVGSRGHGEVVGTLLGSVGLQLLHHADCPAMIVHPVPPVESVAS